MRARKNLGTVGVFVLASLWTFSACWAQVPTKPVYRDIPDASAQVANVSPTNVDLRALKSQVEAFQVLLNRGVQQAFGDQPFSILQDAKGSYLPRYGLAFHMEVNLHPLRLISPFDMRPYTPEELQKAKDVKLERIRQLKAKLSQMLLEHGTSLSAMAPEQNIAIVVSLFNLPSESRDLPTQLSISIDRRMLLDYQSRRLTAEEFEKASTFVEF